MRNVSVYMLAIVFTCGCGERAEAPGADAGQDARVPLDAHVETDAGGEEDARVPLDATVPDDADPDLDGGGDDGGAPLVDAARACMIGQLCNDSQPCPEGAEFRCYGFGGDGFCAPFAPECGGIVMTECTGGRTCIRGGGGSIGYCATSEEMECICTSAAENEISVDGCPDRFFPDAGPPPR